MLKDSEIDLLKAQIETQTSSYINANILQLVAEVQRRRKVEKLREQETKDLCAELEAEQQTNRDAEAYVERLLDQIKKQNHLILELKKNKTGAA